MSFTEGAAALTLLVVLQFAATWLSVRWSTLREALISVPTLLVRDGELLVDAMRRQRGTDNEIYQSAGAASPPRRGRFRRAVRPPSLRPRRSSAIRRGSVPVISARSTRMSDPWSISVQLHHGDGGQGESPRPCDSSVTTPTTGTGAGSS
ncbi:hypothetical protein [Actinoplanes nipponensis]|uniref:hypothetical protein n=1 Tax=Actinoplanes nipponensis TaxID=135950 RepID=UPI0019438C2E|nr:hypothetical protein [Actinoplanes nipponensis]